MNLSPFLNSGFYDALRGLFVELRIPLHEFTRLPGLPGDILQRQYRPGHPAHDLIGDIYMAGLVDENAFKGEEYAMDPDQIRAGGKDYDGILVFGLELKQRDGDRLPTRGHLAEITRAFNREFHYTPVVVVFRYNKHITLAAAERIRFKQTWREGEKAGKVSLIKDINIEKPHAGHERILASLGVVAIREYDRKNKVESFADLYKGWQRVLSTDVLNEQFYKDYQGLSRELINKVFPQQINNKLKAHQGVLNLLNRMMFVCFIQKKGWLMNDQEFLYHLWQDYVETGREEDKFHEDWLNKVFFLAFNGKAISDKRGKLFLSLPPKYHEAILVFPYLNGGLFTKTKEDDFLLEDEAFKTIFDFMQGYIFTIDEETTEDVNLEINPQLLGKMYEGMINATDLDDVDAEHGIVYTERPEINFMTRRSFVEVLHKKLPKGFTREFLYHLCFDTTVSRRELLKRYKPDLKVLEEAILSITALDPSCGSGSMLLGVIQLMVELLQEIADFSGKPYSNRELFQLKKRIISESIYGVDVKEWAVRIAELRFWLYMIADAEFTSDELTKTPLLPNLDFKLRKGNSLIQEIGNMEFSVKGLFENKKRSAGAAGKLNRFINKKKRFIQNQEESDVSFEKMKEEELIVFKEFLKDQMFENNKKIFQYSKGDGQQTIFGDEKKNLFEAQINDLEQENEQLQRILREIQTSKQIPFSFDIDFMEIFLTKDDPGFDLVIGNPPYVRQEDILPADDALELERLLKPENKEEKRKISADYKMKLSDKVYNTYPFLKLKASTVVEGKNRNVDLYGKKVPGRSDLYVYFQLLCPALLNTKGTFCFIISNSWLDVEYGGYVQQFLLKHTRLHAIYDCTVRSFSAGINTIIYLHSAIQNIKLSDAAFKRLTPPDEPVRFVMNKADYTDTAYAPLLVEQEHCSSNTFRDHYRVIVKTQKELWDEGFDEETMRYAGDKWGGKWLYSPQIYFYILEKGNYIKLKDATIYTQRNTLEVFNYYEIKNEGHEGAIPFLDSSRQAIRILQNEPDFTKFISSNFRYSIKCNDYKKPDIISNRFIGERIFFIEGGNFVIGDTFFVAKLKKDYDKALVLGCLNATITLMNVLVTGRKNMGDGVLLFYGPEFRNLQFYIPETKMEQVISAYKKLRVRKVEVIGIEIGLDISKPIRDQEPNPLSDRKELDDIIFDELGLTEAERKEVYWATAELVKQRLDKAGSR